MPDTDVLVSELTQASSINTTDLLLMTQPDGDAQTGYSSRKGTVLQVANKLLKDTEYTTDLANFENKTVFGALNEIHNGVYLYKENETPYQLRQTPITANRCLEKLIGVSCAFNQLVNTGDTSINTVSGRKYLTKINNVWSIIQGGSAVTIVDDSSDMVIDLTACFGSEVADYLYTLEQNTQGSGVALFKQLFPEDYYAYQTASLESAKPVSKKIYDSDNNVIAEYPLGSDELRGLLKVENGNLVAFGDVHNSDGTGMKYFGIVDLGEQTWVKIGMGGSRYGFRSPISDMALTPAATVAINAICDKYSILNGNDVYLGNVGLAGWGVGTHDIAVYDIAYESGDAMAFKTAMSGVYLIYELATPTPTTYTAFTNPMISGSTEEFTDSRSVKMPCGHDSLYYTSNFKYW